MGPEEPDAVDAGGRARVRAGLTAVPLDVRGVGPGGLKGAVGRVPAHVWLLATLWLPLLVAYLLALQERSVLAAAVLVLPVLRVLHGPGPRERARRADRRRQRDVRRRSTDPTPVPVPPAVVPPAEERLTRTLARAEASAVRLGPVPLDLVRDVGQVLGPLLSQLRTRPADPRVRHDLEAIALDHLPRTLAVFLVLPDDYARSHVTRAGTTPAQELRSQLELLLSGCRRLRDAVLADDVDRQQQQSRFLAEKFAPGELDLRATAHPTSTSSATATARSTP